MPPKKRPIIDGSKIVNMYEYLPKELLNKSFNPNYDLHKMKTPFRACINAPSGSGKSNFIVNLIMLFCKGEGTFSDIFLITRNKDEPLYKWLESVSPRILIKEGIENIPDLDKFDKDENHLVIFDDLVLEKNQSKIENFYIRCRKLNTSVLYLSQSYFRIPKVIRTNCNYLILLKLSGDRELNLILSEGGLGLSKEKLLNMYKYATAEKFSPLFIDYDENPENRYRKGLLEILDPSKF